MTIDPRFMEYFLDAILPLIPFGGCALDYVDPEEEVDCDACPMAPNCPKWDNVKQQAEPKSASNYYTNVPQGAGGLDNPFSFR